MITKAIPIMARAVISKQKGTPGIEIKFLYKDGEIEKQIFWTAWLSAGALDKSMDTLVNVLGYNGTDIVDGNGVFMDKNAIAFNKEVAITIEDEEYNGKMYPKVKWVNAIGEGKNQVVDPSDIKSVFQKNGVMAAFLAAKKSKQEPVSMQEPKFNTDEQLPF